MKPLPAGTGGGLNLYAYVGGDPVNARDPSGLMACPPDNPGGCEPIVVTGQPFCPEFATCLRDPAAIHDFLADFQNSDGLYGLHDGPFFDERGILIPVLKPAPVPLSKCVAEKANAHSVSGAIIGGAAAIAAGAPIFPKRFVAGGRFGGRVGIAGGERSGRFTSVFSAAARSFFGGSRTIGRGPFSNVVAGLSRSRSLGGSVGRLGSRVLNIAGAALEAKAAGKVVGAFLECRAEGK